jgi:hypothetical protein
VAERYPDVVSRLIGALDAWESGMIQPTVPSTRGTVATVEGVPVELVF